MDMRHGGERGRSIKRMRILAVCVFCILLALLLVLGIARQYEREGKVEVMGNLTAGYLPPRAAGAGFETWVLVQNPGQEAARVGLVLNTGEGEVRPPGLQGVEIPAGGRKSFSLHDFVHTYHVSTTVRASAGEVVCERAMY